MILIWRYDLIRRYDLDLPRYAEALPKFEYSGDQNVHSEGQTDQFISLTF